MINNIDKNINNLEQELERLKINYIVLEQKYNKLLYTNNYFYSDKNIVLTLMVFCAGLFCGIYNKN